MAGQNSVACVDFVPIIVTIYVIIDVIVYMHQACITNVNWIVWKIASHKMCSIVTPDVECLSGFVFKRFIKRNNVRMFRFMETKMVNFL